MFKYSKYWLKSEKNPLTIPPTFISKWEKMKNSALLLSLILLVSCQSNSSQDLTEDQALPNIILLIGDDQGYPCFGFMGADYVQTPNLDQLANNGVLFTDGYVSDNHCRPSLQTLLTGMLPTDYHSKSEEIFQESIVGQEPPGIP